jgi:hypothetical protein
MTRVRFLSAMAFAVSGAIFLTLAGGLSAAPVPKDAGKNNPTPDLKVFFDTVNKAVKDEKWPAEADEKILRGTTQSIFERALKAADQKERKLPVDFAMLTKSDVAKEYKATSLTGGFVVAGDVRVPRIKDSVIFASGKVQFTNAKNCVIVGWNVRGNAVDNCVIVAGDYNRLAYAQRQPGDEASVLIAGQWIRAARMDGAICHVIRPSGLPMPDEKPGDNVLHPPVRTNYAKNVIFLHERYETGANTALDCTYLPQKNPIAK